MSREEIRRKLEQKRNIDLQQRIVEELARTKDGQHIFVSPMKGKAAIIPKA